MLLRDAPELEVFVLERTPRAVFGPGATVFPGGAVDPGDADAVGAVVGLDDAAASAEHGLATGGLSLRVAAVRECFEEAGILLARDAASRAPADAKVEWRDALHAGHATMAHVLATEGLVIDARDLRIFAHWLTPVGAPRRYDTWFFVAAAPDGHAGVHDDVELVASDWVRPVVALERHSRGEIDLVFPTLRSLATLARFGHASEVLAALDAIPRHPGGRPVVVPDGTGERVLLPGDDPALASTWTIPLPDLDPRAEARFLSEGVV
jgi:8-oxo-dGTP pyrophosphatase MutT (NUDIX family)